MDEVHRNHFSAAVKIVYEHWTAFKLVLEHQEPNDEAMRERMEELCELTVRFFEEQGKSGLEVYDLEANLEAFIQHYYDVDIEDGSYNEVAEHLCRFYYLVVAGNISELKHLLESTYKGCNSLEKSIVDIETDGEDSEEDGISAENQEPTEHCITSGISGTEGEKNERGIEVDEDGFIICRRGNKRSH